MKSVISSLQLSINLPDIPSLVHNNLSNNLLILFLDNLDKYIYIPLCTLLNDYGCYESFLLALVEGYKVLVVLQGFLGPYLGS